MSQLRKWQLSFSATNFALIAVNLRKAKSVCLVQACPVQTYQICHTSIAFGGKFDYGSTSLTMVSITSLHANELRLIQFDKNIQKGSMNAKKIWYLRFHGIKLTILKRQIFWFLLKKWLFLLHLHLFCHILRNAH